MKEQDFGIILKNTDGDLPPGVGRFARQQIKIAPTPVDVCPRCYEERDAVVPLMTYSGSLYARNPETGERLREIPSGLRICVHCLWTDAPVKDED